MVHSLSLLARVIPLEPTDVQMGTSTGKTLEISAKHRLISSPPSLLVRGNLFVCTADERLSPSTQTPVNETRRDNRRVVESLLGNDRRDFNQFSAVICEVK